MLSSDLKILDWNIPKPTEKKRLEELRHDISIIDPYETSISCVDGRRPNEHGNKAYIQLLGGSLHSISWVRFAAWMNDEQITFAEAHRRNQLYHSQEKLRCGVHTGSKLDTAHGRTDCGFSDNFGIIAHTFALNADAIRNLLEAGFEQNKLDSLIDEQTWTRLKLTAIEISARAKTDIGHAFLTSSEMLAKAETVAGQAAVLPLTGEHSEDVAHVTAIDGHSLNVVNQNKNGQQAFNLDLWYAIKIANTKSFSEEAGVSKELAIALSLGLYQATERVLRPDKSPLPIGITHALSQLSI